MPPGCQILVTPPCTASVLDFNVVSVVKSETTLRSIGTGGVCQGFFFFLELSVAVGQLAWGSRVTTVPQ